MIYNVFTILLISFASCESVNEKLKLPEPIELKDYETIISYEEMVLANPQRIRFDGDEGLVLFDSGLENVIRLSLEGEILSEIGRKGSGPGEYQSVSNIYVLNNSIFLVDDRQFIIHRFLKDGSHISSFIYGDYGKHRINRPTVLNQKDLLIPNSYSEQALFKLMNPKGEQFGELGQIPKGSVDELDYDVYRAAISNREVPPYFKPHVFAVNNDVNSIYIIYEAIPKIRKYNFSGELLWETESIDAPEIDSVAIKYYNFMEMILRQTNAVQPLRKYVDGVSKNGRLFVSTNTSHNNPLWIHEFKDKGNLVNRYVLKSDVSLKSYFDIDTDERRIFVLTKEGGIRAYQY